MIELKLGIFFNTINIFDSSFIRANSLENVQSSSNISSEHRYGKNNLIITIEDIFPYVADIKIVADISEHVKDSFNVKLSVPSKVLELCDGNGDMSSYFELMGVETQIKFCVVNGTELILEISNIKKITQLISEDLEEVLVNPEVDLSTMTLLNEPLRIPLED